MEDFNIKTTNTMEEMQNYKNKRHLLVTIFAALLAMMPQQLAAYDFMVDGLCYNITGGTTVAVTHQNSSSPMYTDLSGNLTIPETVTYNGITYSVTSIGWNAFEGCSGLTSVIIPNSVTAIDYFAFRGCSGLTSVNIPNSVTTIDPGAFYSCSGLTSVTIPNTVTSIGNDAFGGCSGLESIKVASGNRVYDSRNDCNAIILTTFNTLIAGCKTTTIPNSVTAIGIDAFSGCSGMRSITIPNSVTTIGSYAFYGCSALTSVTIPNTVTSIGNDAFGGCSGLEIIKVASGNATYDSRNSCNAIIETATNTLIAGCKTTIIPNSVTAIGIDAFSGCSGMRSITIPNSVTTIGSYAFYGCSALTSVTIPNSVTAIGDYAFDGCINLTSVTIGNSVTSIGDNAFQRTAWFDNQSDGLVYAGLNAYRYKGTMPAGTSIVIKEGTKSISSFCFYNCSGLTSVTIPKSVTSIGRYAFLGCSNLTTIDSYIIHPSEVTMGEYVFNGVPKSSCSLYVIEESLSEYQATSPWNEFNIIAKTIRLQADTIHYVRGTGNTVVELPIELVNYKTVSGLQFDMNLGGNMSFNLRNGVPDIWLDDNRKARNHTVAVERQSEGSEHYRVLVSSPTSQSLKGNDGVLLHANMQINKYGSAGLFPIGYSNITMAAPDETQYHQDPWQSYLSYEYIVGDANADTQVNVGDFGVTANKILNREVNSLYFDDAANVNQDYVVNVADLVGIANIALGIRPKEIRRSPAMHDAQSITHDPTSLHASTDSNQIAIALDNEVAIAGLQMDIVLPQGVTVAHAQLQGRADGHDLQVATLPDGRVRLLVAAFSDRDIAAGDDTILTLTLDGDIDGVATIGGTAAERSLISHELDEVCVPMGTTGIDGTTACNEVRIYARNGNIVIDSPTAGTAQLVMLNGITRDLNVKAGRNTYPMPSGYYIVRMAGATAKVKI